jgi:hypothetical protein
VHVAIAVPGAFVIVTVSRICSNGGQLTRYLELHWRSTTLSLEVAVVESATMIVGASFVHCSFKIHEVLLSNPDADVQCPADGVHSLAGVWASLVGDCQLTLGEEGVGGNGADLCPSSDAGGFGAAKIESTGKVDFSSHVISNLHRFDLMCVDLILCPHNIKFM